MPAVGVTGPVAPPCGAATANPAGERLRTGEVAVADRPGIHPGYEVFAMTRRNDCGNCLVVALMVGAILAGIFAALATPRPVFGAPVPKGPPPVVPDPIVVGYQWNYSGYLLVVTAVDGDCIAYKCLNRPSQTWPGLDGYVEICRQSKERTKTEAETYKNHELLPWEFEF